MSVFGSVFIGFGIIFTVLGCYFIYTAYARSRRDPRYELVGSSVLRTAIAVEDEE